MVDRVTAAEPCPDPVHRILVTGSIHVEDLAVTELIDPSLIICTEVTRSTTT